MSRASWINELVDAGYEAGVIATLNNNELAQLVQEEYVENTWSNAARSAAAAKRARKAIRAKTSDLAKQMHIGLKKDIHKLRRGSYERKSTAGVLRSLRKPDMSKEGQARTRMRKMQDELLSKPAVKKFISDHGDHHPLWEGGPSAASMRSYLHPKHESTIQSYLNLYS